MSFAAMIYTLLFVSGNSAMVWQNKSQWDFWLPDFVIMMELVLMIVGVVGLFLEVGPLLGVSLIAISSVIIWFWFEKM